MTHDISPLSVLILVVSESKEFKIPFSRTDVVCVSLRMKTGAFLSTGFFAMILAIDMCDSIHVYGMIDDNYCR